jgi:signal transduction histidine kinase
VTLIEHVTGYSEHPSILVIDDNHDSLRLLVRILNERGYAVRAMPDGRMGLVSAMVAPPDVILLDIMLPDMDGYTVCEKLKSDQITRDIPVIFISALNEVVDKVRGFAIGGVDYVTKPFQAEEVLARVTTHYTLRTMQIQLQEQNAHLQKEIIERKRAEEALRHTHDQLEKRVEDRTTQLAAKHEQLQRLARQMTFIQEEERRRLSRELHDEANQSLMALMISLQLVQDDLYDRPDDSHRRLDEALQLASATMDRLRALARNLRPPALDTLGLDGALEAMGEAFARQTNLTINVVTIRPPVFSDEANICLYRFAQEALTNIARHAGAHHVWVTLNHDCETVSITVEDDGQGIHSEKLSQLFQSNQGLGLLGMRERLEFLNGTLEIDSAPGMGTRIIATLPCG